MIKNYELIIFVILYLLIILASYLNIWVLLLLIIFLIILGLYFFYDDNEEIEEVKKEEIEYKSETINNSIVHHTIKDFSLIEIENDDVEDFKTIDYNEFKILIEQENFIRQFTEAIKVNLEMKRSHYQELHKYYKKEVSIFSDGDVRNENRKLSLKTLKTIIDIILEIDRKLLEINPTIVGKNLRDAVYNQSKGMESLIGRQQVKDFLSIRLYSFSRNPKASFKKFFNLNIYAPSGAGKTKLASVISFVLSKSGILVYDNIVMGTKTSLISPYVNATAEKTRSTLISSLESVFFIDEAYSIVNQNANYGNTADHSSESIAELINFADKMIGLSIIIFAGYEEQMTQFMNSNEGLERRFLPPIILESYNNQELSAILINFLQESEIVIGQRQANYLYSLITQYRSYITKEAGSCLNLSEKINLILLSSDRDWESNYKTILNKAFKEYIEKKY